jgi:hypothetical protein
MRWRTVMISRNSSLSKIAGAFVGVAAWVGLIVQFYVTQTSPNLSGVSAFERTLRYFEYFTIITNLIVAVSLTVSLLLPRSRIGWFFSRSCTATAVALYIVMVGLVYNIVLASLHEFEGAAQLANFLTHILVPIAYFVYWLFFVRKGQTKWTMPLLWLIYPAVYVVYALIRASATGRYPYPFLDIARLGAQAVLLNTVVLTIAFFALGELFVAADKLLTRILPNVSVE